MDGGGFYLFGYLKSLPTVADSTITGNTAGGDGGGFFSGGQYSFMTQVTGSTISDNAAGSDGGGFHCSGTTVTGSIITGNTANGGRGGGLYSGYTTIENSIITDNISGSYGGGFCSGKGTIENSIISRNTASENGAGFYSESTKILNSIIINSINAEGVYLASGTDNYILNSVFVDNENYDVVGASGVIATIYNNYIDQSKINITSFKKNNIFDGNLDFTDQPNGDFHIGENSVLIDAGTTDIEDVDFPETDLDGYARIAGLSIDIGPYEFSTKRPTIDSFSYTGNLVVGQDLTFTIDATPFGGRTISKYEIDFGNGIYVTVNDTTRHNYAVSGDFSVRAKVTDSAGEFSIKTIDLSIVSQAQAVMDFVTRFYQVCLNREPDQAGLDDWTTSLLNGDRTGADVAKGFILSQEFVNRNVSDEEYLNILYGAFFDRQPDIGGYNYWLDQLGNNGDREQVLDGFIYSREFANLCFEYGISPDPVYAFVTRFYKHCLGRYPDQVGLDYWVNSLKDGSRTGSDVAFGFVFSQEFLNMGTSNEQYLDVLYHAFFNREPDQEGFDGWLSQLNSGASRDQILNGFVYAQEFYNLCGEYGITPN